MYLGVPLRNSSVLKQSDFNAIVEKAFATQVDFLASRGIQAHIDLDRSIPEIFFDENQVMQILHNLIRNVAEHNRRIAVHELACGFFSIRASPRRLGIAPQGA